MYNLHSPADSREAHAHSVPYAPLATVLDTIEEVKAVAKQQQNLPLFTLCKMLAQVACIAYTSPTGGEEKAGPAIYSVPPQRTEQEQEDYIMSLIEKTKAHMYGTPLPYQVPGFVEHVRVHTSNVEPDYSEPKSIAPTQPATFVAAFDVLDPAWPPLPITLVAPQPTQTPQANPPAAVAGQGVGLDPTPPYTLDVVLRITFEKPVDVSEHKLRQAVKDMVGGRAWTMNNVKFVEVL